MSFLLRHKLFKNRFFRILGWQGAEWGAHAHECTITHTRLRARGGKGWRGVWFTTPIHEIPYSNHHSMHVKNVSETSSHQNSPSARMHPGGNSGVVRSTLITWNCALLFWLRRKYIEEFVHAIFLMHVFFYIINIKLLMHSETCYISFLFIFVFVPLFLFLFFFFFFPLYSFNTFYSNGVLHFFNRVPNPAWQLRLFKFVACVGHIFCFRTPCSYVASLIFSWKKYFLA